MAPLSITPRRNKRYLAKLSKQKKKYASISGNRYALDTAASANATNIKNPGHQDLTVCAGVCDCRACNICCGAETIG
jgi:hypothetical protein